MELNYDTELNYEDDISSGPEDSSSDEDRTTESEEGDVLYLPHSHIPQAHHSTTPCSMHCHSLTPSILTILY